MSSKSVFHSIFEMMGTEEEKINFESLQLMNLTLDDIISKRYLSYISKRNGLLHVSKLIEEYAVKQKLPLLIDIQTSKRFQLSKNRLSGVFEKIPKIFLIGNFNNDLNLSSKVQIINCKNSILENNWIVLSKDEKGFFGLITEQLDDTTFRGFYTGDSELIETLLELLSTHLGTDVTF